ncbi:hypothetical protein EMCRGX_G021583, partial [Ephydatia muelleri]
DLATGLQPSNRQRDRVGKTRSLFVRQRDRVDPVRLAVNATGSIKLTAASLARTDRVQEPNVETDHLESSTSGSVNLLNQSFDTRFQPTRQDVCWSGGHALLPKTNQMGRCVQRRHMCPVPAMEAYRECCHCSTHSSPSSTSKMGEHSHLRASAPPFYPWYGGAMWLQSSQI